MSLAVAAIGVIVSLRTGSNVYFMVMSIPAAILIVTGGVMIRRDLLTGEKRLLLEGGEQTIKAQVLGVSRNLRTAGEKTTYYVVCRGKDPVTGREETYSSRPLDEYPGKEVIGREVTVRLDPHEKGRYTVEVDDLLAQIRKEKEEKKEKEEADRKARSEDRKRRIQMSKQTACIDEFIKSANADEPVYITDIRRAFEAVGGRPFHLHVLLYDRETEVFATKLPAWENEAQKEFVTQYVRAFFYNLMSTLGALKVTIYLDTSDAELKGLAEGLREDFQLDIAKPERSGYGKSLNVNERIVNAITGGKGRFTIEVKDLTEEPAVRGGNEEPQKEAVFTKLPERAKDRFLLGVDVGGTDIKFAVSLDGKLLHCEELNWAPASFANVEQLTGPVMEAAERLMNEFGGGRKWDGIGLSWPDAIIDNKIVGGETTKTKGLRENKDRDYEEQLAKLTGLCGDLQKFVTDKGAVMCCNDGPMAAFTSAVEMAAAGEDVSKGFMAYSLGTELGTGWVRADGSIPPIPLEVYNCIIDLGSRKAAQYQAEDIRSCRNVNTLLAGSLQKYTGQSGVFRLACKELPAKEPALYEEVLKRGLFETNEDGSFICVPTEPEDRRKECLEFFMDKAASGESEVCREIFRQIGGYIAVTWAENEYMLHPEASERTLYGRLVKRKECFDLIKEGAAQREPSLVLRNADSSLAVTPLMKQLDDDPVFTVAQFAQAVGALYFACRDKDSSAAV